MAFNPYLDAKTTAPAQSGPLVTPNDAADLPGGATRGLIVSVAGALKVDWADGSTTTIPNVTAGDHPYQVKRVYATGTAATGIVALY